MSNNVRNVTKQLLGAEDVAFGRGVVQQNRGGALVPIHKLDLDLPVADESELATTDTAKYPKASIGSRLFVAVNGQYQELAHIVPVIYRVGGALSAEYPYCENGNVIAKWNGEFPKTLTSEDADFSPVGWQIYTVGSGRTIVSETQPPVSYGEQGMRWYNPSLPATFIYYVDGDSGQWVEEAHEGIDGGLRADLSDVNSDVPIAGVRAGKLSSINKCVFDQATLDANKAGLFYVTDDFTLTQNTIITGIAHFLNGKKITVPTGITLTLGTDSTVHAQGEYINNTGGTVVYGQGACENKIHRPVPTGTWALNHGYVGNTNLSGATFVFGGSQSFPHSVGTASELTVIGGGYDNVIGDNCSATAIAGGAHHIVGTDASHSAILGGAYQFSYASYGVLGGGKDNKTYSTFGGVFSGQANEAGDSTGATPPLDNRSAFVGSGASNKAIARRSFIGAGNQNTITQVAFEAFNGAGISNTVSGLYAFNGAGSTSTISGQGAANIAGASNTASGLASLTHGESNTASGAYAVALGEFHLAEGGATFSSGRRTRARLYGQRTHSSGYFTQRGDSQLSDVVARKQTVGSQTVTLDLNNGTANPIVMPDNTAWLYEIQLIGRSSDGASVGGWLTTGLINRGANAASTVLVGTPNSVVLNAPTNWSYTVSADTTNGALRVNVSTAAGVTATIRWTASIKLTEVS